MEPKILLKQAVNNIVACMKHDGMDAHTATVKVARDMDLNANFIKRASEVLNVALTYNHFKKNAEAKDADFPIVDAAKVVSEIYNTSEKTASEKKTEKFSQAILPDEIPDFNKYLHDPMFKQAYDQIVNSTENYDSFELSSKGVMEKSAQVVDWYERQIDELQYKQADAKDRYNKAFFELAHGFKKDAGYRTSFEEFEKQAVVLYGSKAQPYIEFIHELSAENEKRAELDPQYKDFNKCKEAELLGEFLTQTENFKQASAKLGSLTADFEECKQTTKEAYRKFGQTLLSDFDFVASEVTLDKTAEEKTAAPIEEDPVKLAVLAKQAAMEGNIDPADEAKYLTPLQASSLPASLKRKIINSKKSKGHVMKTAKAADMFGVLGSLYKDRSTPGSTLPSTGPNANLDRQLMLQELMHTDPILSTKNPQDVASAYGQMMRLAPELAGEKDVVKAILRSSTESQALDPHTANQLIEANTNLMKQKSLAEGGGKGLK